MAADLPSAGSLRFSLAARRGAEGPARVVVLGDLEVELRAVGGGHQAIVRGARQELCETVGPLVAGDAGIPAWLECHDAAGRYVFRSSVQRVAPGVLERRAAAVRDHARADPAALLDDGQDEAEPMTAVACRELPGGVAWASWRLYPQAGELVITRSRLLAA